MIDQLTADITLYLAREDYAATCVRWVDGEATGDDLDAALVRLETAELVSERAGTMDVPSHYAANSR